MIYHWFQNSVWKVVKIAKTSNLKSAVKSQTITTVRNKVTKLVKRDQIRGFLTRLGTNPGPKTARQEAKQYLGAGWVTTASMYKQY